MLVELRSLKPNPMRDFTVDPMNAEVVEKLRQSIKEDGFWGGVVCRQTRDGIIQIGAGHHRVKAAILAGVQSADLYVGNADIDDAAMVRIYARENATQRGNSGTAQAGSVASAIRFIAKAVMGGVSQEFLRNEDVPKIRGNLTSDKGLGQSIIVKFLERVPNINDSTVQQALANLKASGDYARIIREVEAEIERENREALKALARAEKEKAAAEKLEQEAIEARKAAAAAAKTAREEASKKRAELERQRAEAEEKLAAKRRKEAETEMAKFDSLRKTRDTAAKATEAASNKPVTFDFEGVAKHLKVAHHIDVFRELVTGPGIAPYLPITGQASLAAEMVRLASQREKGELTGAFMKENVMSLVMNAKAAERQYNKEERERLEREDILMRARNHEEEFARHVSMMDGTGRKLLKLQEQWPKGLVFPITDQFRRAIKRAKEVIDQLNERI
jgi:ParB/Sulfiredoxin domain